MVTKNAFEALSVETTQVQIKNLQEEIRQLNDNLLMIMMAIFEKMPRVTGADQAAVWVENAPNISTCATVTTLNELRYATGKSVFGDNLNLSGCQHIYNNIVVS